MRRLAKLVDVVDLNVTSTGLRHCGCWRYLVVPWRRARGTDYRNDVLAGRARVEASGVGFDGQLLVDLVAADLGDASATRVKVEVVEQRLGSVDKNGGPAGGAAR